jgi:hypothetical protein
VRFCGGLFPQKRPRTTSEQPNHFSWLTGGRGLIGLASTAARASLVVTMDTVYLVSENIAARRLFTEHLAENPEIEVLEYPWYCPDTKQKRFDASNLKLGDAVHCLFSRIRL